MGPKLLVFAFTFIVLGMSWMGHHRNFSYISKVDGRLLWMNLSYLLAACLVPFASSVLAEHGSRFAFALYAVVMGLTDMMSASLSAYGLRAPFLRAHPKPQPGLRRDMILQPLLAAVIFGVAATMALGGLVRFAHWTLILVTQRFLLPEDAKRLGAQATSVATNFEILVLLWKGIAEPLDSRRSILKGAEIVVLGGVWDIAQ